MEFPTRTALLLALEDGPGFGLELIARVSERTMGRVHLNRGGVYLVLRTLEREGLVRSWGRPSRGVGRPRRYYELTSLGMIEAEKDRACLRGLVGPEVPGVTAEEARRMADRIIRSTDLNRFGFRLREAGRRAGLSR